LSKVRLRLSGALMFAANLVGYLTGFLFTVFITRRLSEEEFGVWALIGSFITYSLMPFNLVSSWISRDAARGKKILSSAAALFLLLTPISIIIYFSIALGSAAAINYGHGIIALGIIILIPYILLTLGTAIQSGYAPQNLGIARIIFEVSKVAIAFYLVVTLRLGLLGAFISLSIAYLLQASLLLRKSKPLFQKQMNKELMRKWLKGIPVSAIQVLNNALAATDVVLIGLITGSAVIAGYWQAAVAASALAASSSLLMTGLAPRLLSGGAQRDLDKAFDFTMILSIPMLLGFLTLSRDILWILRPTYSAAWAAASLLAVKGVIGSLSRFGSLVVFGSDHFDRGEHVSMKDYLKSGIFLLNKVNLFLSILYIASVAVFLLTAKTIFINIAELVTLVALISLIFMILRSVVNLRIMKKLTKLKLTYRNLGHYMIASMIMAASIYFLRGRIGPLPSRAVEAAPPILGLVLLGAAIYGAVLYLISKHFRSFLKEVWSFVSRYS